MPKGLAGSQPSKGRLCKRGVSAKPLRQVIDGVRRARFQRRAQPLGGLLLLASRAVAHGSAQAPARLP